MSEYFWPIQYIRKTKKKHICFVCDKEIEVGSRCKYQRVKTYEMNKPNGYYFHENNECYLK